jgi:hypothetical protein
MVASTPWIAGATTASADDISIAGVSVGEASFIADDELRIDGACTMPSSLSQSQMATLSDETETVARGFGAYRARFASAGPLLSSALMRFGKASRVRFRAR